MRGQIAAHRDALLALLRTGRSIPANNFSPVHSIEDDQPSPLSFAQERLWFLEQWAPGRAIYNLCRAVRITGALNTESLTKSFDEIIKRHEVLRTKFIVAEGRPAQLITAAKKLSIHSHDLRSIALSARARAIARLIRTQAGEPFDLSEGRLLRVALLRQSEHEHVLVVTTHHMVADAWSLAILMRELWTFYEAFVEGRPARLSPLTTRYRDYVLWQRQSLTGPVLDSHLSYWRKQLAGAPVLDLPTDRPRPPRQSFHGARQRLALSRSLTDALNALSRREGVSLFMILTAALQLLLSRYSGQEDIVVGTAAANRRRTEFEGMLGFFVNTLALRADLSGRPRFVELLRRVKDVCLDADAHQEIPFEKVVAELNVERELSGNPLFQVMLVLQNTPAGAPQPRGMTLTPMEVDTRTAQFDLSLYLRERAGRLIGYFEYATDLFDRATIERMAGHFQVLLTAVVEKPQSPIATLPIVTAAERRRLLVSWNDTAADYPRQACIHDLFQAQVKRTPTGLALECDNVRLRYRELNRRANRLARQLAHLDIGPEKIVGVLLDRSIDMVVTLLAVLKAGGAYLPLDPAYPKARLQFILADADAGLVLTEKNYGDLLGNYRGKVVCIDRLHRHTGKRDANPKNQVTAENSAYVIYTSGSSGRPKGVVGLHRGAINRFSWMWKVYPFAADEKNCQKTSLCFVDSIWETFGALLQGVPTAIIPDASAREPQLLVRSLSERNVTRLVVVPSLLQAILDQCPDIGTQLADLRYCFSSGETLPLSLAERFRAQLPNCRLINLYGSSEVSADVTCYEFASAGNRAAVPIGRPIHNSQVYLLDGNLQPVPIGVRGELYIGGDNLARGYLHRDDLTAERFVANPFDRNGSGYLFRSGDLARYRADGNLEFLGRADQQVKIRGCRIELSEVEAALARHQGIRHCAVAVSDEEPRTASKMRQANTARSLVAYVVPLNLPPSALALRSFLRGRLPDFMIPSTFIPVDALPLLPNGKIDRRALTLVRQTVGAGAPIKDEPRTEMEAVVAQIWREALHLPKIGIDDNFFELGGHSLRATQIIAQLRATLDRPVALHTIFEAPTISGMATIIEDSIRTGATANLPGIEHLPHERFAPMSLSQERLFVFAQLFGGGDFLNLPYAYRIAGPLDPAALHQAIREIIRRHATLRSGFAEVDGEPRQVVRRRVTIKMPFVDLLRRSPQHLQSEVERLSKTDAMRVFDLENPPLLRVKLLRVAEDRHILLVTMHHIVSDQWSMGIFRKELAMFYAAITQGLPLPSADLPIQFSDFARWQRKILAQGLLDGEISFWRAQLGASSPRLLFRRSGKRVPDARFHSTRKSIEIDEPLFTRIKHFAGERHCTSFMVCVAALNILLHRLTGETDIRIGTFTANRGQPGTEGIIGCFVNALILRTTVYPQLECRELLKAVRRVCLSAFAHQDAPFEFLESVLDRKPKSRSAPLYQVMLNYRNLSAAPEISNGVTISPWYGKKRAADPGIAIARLDLDFHLRELPTKVTGVINYKTDLFSDRDIVKVVEGFLAILDQLVADADRRISKISLK